MPDARTHAEETYSARERPRLCVRVGGTRLNAFGRSASQCPDATCGMWDVACGTQHAARSTRHAACAGCRMTGDAGWGRAGPGGAGRGGLGHCRAAAARALLGRQERRKSRGAGRCAESAHTSRILFPPAPRHGAEAVPAARRFRPLGAGRDPPGPGQLPRRPTRRPRPPALS